MGTVASQILENARANAANANNTAQWLRQQYEQLALSIGYVQHSVYALGSQLQMLSEQFESLKAELSERGIFVE